MPLSDKPKTGPANAGNNIEIVRIDESRKKDVDLPNEPFPLSGKLHVYRDENGWRTEAEYFPEDKVTEMCFPDENYIFEEMKNDIFLGAYQNGVCIGLAVLKPGFFRYLYLYDLKVNRAYRKFHVGKALIGKAKEIALSMGYLGIYTQGQDNNLGACLFYLKSGFVVGGLDTNLYKGTPQEGKSDVIFYLDCSPSAR